MSAVFSATWQRSRLGLSGRTAFGVVRAALVSASSAKQSSRGTTLLASRARPIHPSSLPIKSTRAFQTVSKYRVNTDHAPSPDFNGKPSSPGETGRRSSTLTQAELNGIFGQEIDRNGAAELLSKLQRQRREGTLDQTLPYPGQLIDRGLEYLRAKYPVDEDAAIIARVDREIDGDWSLPQTNPERSRTGRSGLQEIREIMKAKREAEEAEEAAQAAAEKKLISKRPQKSGTLAARNGPKQGALVTGNGPSERRGFTVPESHQKRAEQIDAWIQKSNQRVADLRTAATEKHIPQMSNWQRLWPCGVFTISAVGLALIFAHLYTPPSQKARLFPSITPSEAAVGTIVLINGLVYLSWKFPRAWRTMNRSFVVAPAIPRAFTMLGAPFSHQVAPHLVSNMVGVACLGVQLHDDIGRGPFLALVVCGSVIPSFCALVPLVMNKIFITATLGASGVLTTLIGTAFVLYEGREVTFSFLPPGTTSWMDTAVILAILIAVDVIQFARHGLVPRALVNSGKSHVDYVGHLAGYATGIGAGCLIRHSDPYWGNVQRKSFWRWKHTQSEDPATEVVMKPEALGIRADTGKQ